MVELIKTIDGKEHRMHADEATAKRLIETDQRFRIAKDAKPPAPEKPDKPDKPDKPEKSSDPKDPVKE